MSMGKFKNIVFGWVGFLGVFSLHGAPTFNREIAPIIYAHCSPCHRNSQAAPFDLITFQDVKKHAEQIATVVESGYMPPWLPEQNPAGFKNDRSISSSERAALLEWVSIGAPEGDPQDLASSPKWTVGWAHGVPDLIVKMPLPYLIGPEGPDIYRNFVIPNVVSSNVNVRMVEFRPENPRILHHTFIKVDMTESSLALEKQGGEVGFTGMNSDAIMPTGQFLSWQPGKQPDASAPVWTLKKGSDFLIQTHLTRSGKPEQFQATLGLYFTPEPAETNYVKLFLGSLALKFKAGETNQVVEDSFVLPVSCDVASVLPHAHYLCRKMEANAFTPDGRVIPILTINKWDFNWQGDYQYAAPIHLPQGTVLKIRYTYDNSALNPKNPNNPPIDVYFGPQSKDEMCEFWLQVLIKDATERKVVQEALDVKWKELTQASILQSLARNPADSVALADLGLLKLGNGKIQEAEVLFTRAIRVNSQSEMGHYRLALVYRMTKRYLDANRELRRALAINPSNEKAWGTLGFVEAEMGHAGPATEAFEKALKLDPSDTYAQSALKDLKNFVPN
ncbi:MAG: Tetratricopeptide 2 repeat protein [Verrucomicrobiales bacterium]|nr:Tetratricopeptide 2 repeat protein [Verrucomicrobiales bacterium]